MKIEKLGPIQATLMFLSGLISLYFYYLHFEGLINGEVTRTLYAYLMDLPGGSLVYVWYVVAGSCFLGTMTIINTIYHELGDIFYSILLTIGLMIVSVPLVSLIAIFGSVLTIILFFGIILNIIFVKK